MRTTQASTRLTIALPAWLEEAVEWTANHATAEDRMRVAIHLARENVRRGTGGPFAALVCERRAGVIVSAAVNCVLPSRNSTLHAELLAIELAEQRLQTFSLGASGLVALELVTTCAPCAMCLGAFHWSGIRRLIIGAPREAAARIGFDEGPVFDESYDYLESRGIEIVRGVLADDATAVLEEYARTGGMIYNG